MPRSRTCLGGCGERLGRAHTCPTCWARLRDDLREAITRARPMTRAYSVALYNAHEWFTENPPPEHPQREAAS
jgi:hypothetical protein